MRNALTTYSDRGGHEFEAVKISWDRVHEILGREHEGHPADDAQLIDYLLNAGAPAWVRDAVGWVDESGWGLIGPRKT